MNASLILESLRPKQWVKNLFVFAAIVFSQNLHNIYFLFRTVLAFAVFCALAGAQYIFNDIADLERDKSHPGKRNRPLASGRLNPDYARNAAYKIVAGAILLALILGAEFCVVAAAYFLLTLAYSWKLKHIVILDAMTIAIGFVLRVVAGGVVIGVDISSWVLICTVLLALFLAFNKRRHELILLDDNATDHRTILKEYSPYLLDQMIGVVTASTLMAYSLYTVAPETITKFHTTRLDLTIPFVLYGIFRYLYLVHQKKEGGDPTTLMLTDTPLIVNTVLWLVSFELIVFFS
jgi:4-hydroxybenzoate polyprenyltransferase